MTHDWKIPQREYDRQVARRGKLHAFESIDPARTALVVVDMVPFFADENPYCRAIIPAINALAGALREAGGVIAWVVPSSEEPHPALAREFYGERVAELYRNSGGDGPLPGRVCQELDHWAQDLFVEKSCPSAFFPGRCDLAARLAERGIDTVIVTGTTTNVCCESTVRDARVQGYRVILAADATATVNDAMHNGTLVTVYRTFGDVRPTDEILGLIGESAIVAGQA